MIRRPIQPLRPVRWLSTILIGLLMLSLPSWAETFGFPESTVRLEDGVESIMLRNDDDGRFFAQGQINGHNVRFHIDTGATFISIPAAVANRLGLNIYGEGESSTAAGKVTVQAALLDTVSLAGVTVTHLQGRVNETMAGFDILLGNEFLQHFDIQIKGDSLMLHARNSDSARINAAAAPEYHLGLDKLVLEPDADGHYMTSGRINGSVVYFMIDTGADNVVIPARIASRLRLPKLQAIDIITPGGTAVGYVTGPMKIRANRLEVEQMYGIISPKMDASFGLLGIDFLKNFEFEKQGDKLILTIPDGS